MLILSRKDGEGFTIGDNVEVIVFGYKDGAVKIGIRAPREISILRTELRVVQQENCRASAPALSRLERLSKRLGSASPTASARTSGGDHQSPVAVRPSPGPLAHWR